MTVINLADRRFDAPERVMPRNTEAEQALLGAILVNNSAFYSVASFLRPEHFSEEIHRRAFDVMGQMIQGGRIASPTTLKTYLGEQDLGGVTIPQYLAHLASEATAIVAAADYGRAVLDLYARRMIISAADEIAARAYDPPVMMTAVELLDGAEEELRAVRAQLAPVANERSTASALALSTLDYARRIRAGEVQTLGATTGIADLDIATGGLLPGTLWVIGGRPGAGKTIAFTSMARAAAKKGVGVFAASLEIAREQTSARVLAEMCFSPRRPMTFAQIMRGDLDDEQVWRVEEAQQRLEKMPLVFDCSSRLSVPQIRAKVRAERQRVSKHGIRLGVVLIDYLKFVAASDRYKGQRVYEVGEISAGLKQIAKDEEVCVVLMAQLNRQVEGRDDKRPGLADLRESGDLEADADVVSFLYREAYYLERSPEHRRGDGDALKRMEEVRNDLDWIVAKNRAGPTKLLSLWCDVSCSVIASRDRSEN